LFGKTLLKAQMTTCSKYFGGHDPFNLLVYAYELCDLRMCCIWKLGMWLRLLTRELFYFQFSYSAVELFVSYTTGLSLTNAAMCMNLIVFIKHSDIVCYFLVIEILYYPKTTTLHMPDWKNSEGGS